MTASRDDDRNECRVAAGEPRPQAAQQPQAPQTPQGAANAAR